jgi:hypothetical protein
MRFPLVTDDVSAAASSFDPYPKTGSADAEDGDG